MMPRTPIKKAEGAALLFRHRHYFLVGALSVLLAGLVSRAIYLTVVDSEFLRKQGPLFAYRACDGDARDDSGS